MQSRTVNTKVTSTDRFSRHWLNVQRAISCTYEAKRSSLNVWMKWNNINKKIPNSQIINYSLNAFRTNAKILLLVYVLCFVSDFISHVYCVYVILVFMHVQIVCLFALSCMLQSCSKTKLVETKKIVDFQ